MLRIKILIACILICILGGGGYILSRQTPPETITIYKATPYEPSPKTEVRTQTPKSDLSNAPRDAFSEIASTETASTNALPEPESAGDLNINRIDFNESTAHFSESMAGSEVSAEDVPVSPHGFGPYPEVPSAYFRTPVWVKYDDFDFTRGHELIERVLIKLWKQGIYCSGGSIENGRVYPVSRGTVYVKWKGDYISDYIGHPDDDDDQITSILENKGTPAGIRVLDYDTAGIDP